MKPRLTTLLHAGLLAVGLGMIGAGSAAAAPAGLAAGANVVQQTADTASQAQTVQYDRRWRDDRRHWRGDRHWRRHHRPYRPHYRHYGPRSGIYLEFGRPAPRYYAPRRVYRGGSAHVNWCANRYRSYRAYDNTFQPYNGPRRQCISPYV
ncbi:BA14K family protein [Limoniibacter endophyticus]|uniref:BA14K family protein n=1 Tax=Limoniibacter endophyticus TaxID=1565040 RepID=UPI001673797E|nr:BA14K family protein [Limoniibacter endophyticus]